MAIHYRLLDFPTRRPHLMATLYKAKLSFLTVINQLLCLCDRVHIVFHRICLFHPSTGDGRAGGVVVHYWISSYCVLAGVENL